MPYISASIIMQLLTTSLRRSSAEEGRREGRKLINQYTRYLTVVLACCRLTASRSVSKSGAGGIVTEPGWFFRIDRHHADRRHHVPDVARRADHRARRRQRHFADHLRRHRRGIAGGTRRSARPRPHRRSFDRADPAHHRGRGRCDHASSCSSSARSAACWSSIRSARSATGCSRASPRICR